VRWYLRFKLSARNLVEIMAERGLSMAHTTIIRWVQRYAPEFEKRLRRFARAVCRSSRVDETYVTNGATCIVPVDRAGETVDFRLSARRNVAAAKAFFRKAIKSRRRCPQTQFMRFLWRERIFLLENLSNDASYNGYTARGEISGFGSWLFWILTEVGSLACRTRPMQSIVRRQWESVRAHGSERQSRSRAPSSY
jgi:DDE domain